MPDPLTIQEVIGAVILLLIGSLFTLLGFWFRRFISKSDSSSTELRHDMDEIEDESMKRDQKIEREMTVLRNYVDSEFARNRHIDAVETRMDARFSSMEARFTELKTDMDKNFDRLAGLIQGRQ